MLIYHIYFVGIISALAFPVLSLQHKKRHIVFIVVDDWGWGDYGIHGSNLIQTPNMDALAYSGVILHNYYTAAICTPSRAALMTGLHPAHTGMQHGVINPGEPWGLPLNFKILPQYLKDEGYKTYAIGKWHLGDFKEAYTPTRRGFDYHFGYWEGRQSYYTHYLRDNRRKVCGYDMRRNMNISWDSYNKYTTDILTDDAINVIRTHNASTPMFLYISHLAVHAGNENNPFEAPQEIVDQFSYIRDPRRRIFAAMLYRLDDSIGKVVAALGRNNMLSDTIIALTTDNGGAAHHYDCSIGSNWPLRGGKGSYWEGGVRGNAVIWAADLPVPKIENHLMHIQDWLPTLLGAINSTRLLQNDTRWDGRNMWPVLQGIQQSIYTDLVLQVDPVDKSFAYRRGDYKILHGHWVLNKWYNPGNHSVPPDYNTAAVEESSVGRTFRALGISFPTTTLAEQIRQKVTVNCNVNDTSDQIYGRCFPTLEICLYNLKDDPCERNNLALQMPEIVQSLVSQMEQFNFTFPINKCYDKRSNPKFWNNTFTNWCDYIDCEESVTIY